jgi:hypothetical protein
MSRIKAPPQPEETSEDIFDEDSEGYCGKEAPSTQTIVAYGIFLNLIIISIQYCVLRCSKAVKKENICKFLFIGTLICFFTSVASLTIFWDYTVLLLELTLAKL